MSVVYRARSIAPPLGQEAAVKLLSMATATANGRARFEREIKILARLRHPGIAPIFDAGVADDGTPWFAMGLVDGVDVAAWLHDRAPEPRECVQLLLQVCDAVDYAHRHMVIHRDIKPSNVLIDHSGHAVLLDFGISRLLEEGAEPNASLATASYAFSPRFSAPEQVRGGEVTTATDVFGLGCLLHLMLTGQPPVFPEGRPDDECRDPATLARPAEDKGLKRLLSGDLGAILRRALKRDPGERYPGAAELAADLRAWQHGMPVTARPDSTFYRFRKFMLRHKTGTALTTALAVSLLAGATAFGWQAHKARIEAERANLTREFLFDVFAEADVVGRGNRQPDVRATLRKAAELAPTRFANRLDLQSEALRLVGRLQRLNMDNRAAAQTLRKALAVDEARNAPWDDERRHTARQLSTALRLLGKPEEAAKVTQGWMAADPAASRMTSSFHCAGTLDLDYADWHDRRTHYETVLDRCRQFAVGDPQRLLFISRMATVRRVDGDPQGAYELSNSEDVALRQAHNLPADVWRGWADLKTELAQSLGAIERWDDSAKVAGDAVRMVERHVGPNSPFLVGPLRILGGRLRDAERYTDARKALERALKINRNLGDGRIRAEDAFILLDLGATAFAEKDYAASAVYLERSLNAFDVAGIGGIDKGTTLDLLSAARRETGDNRRAAQAARSALAFYRSELPEHTERVAQASLQLCLALAGLGKSDAIAHCEAGLTIDRKERPDNSELLNADRAMLAQAHKLLGR